MSSIKLFESKKIRSAWSDAEQKWFFSITDIITALTDSSRPRKYWSDLKKKLMNECFEQLSEKIGQLKLEADAETLMRLIQSIPSPKAEPFKRWLAKVGYEQIDRSKNTLRDVNKINLLTEGHFRKSTYIIPYNY